MKIGTVAYVPPRAITGAASFYENLQKYPPAGNLVLCSEADWAGVTKFRCSPEFLKGATFIEGKHAGEVNNFALHNGVFLACMAAARKSGFDYALYLEADCRVGCKGWDEIIFDEYFSLGRPTIVAGTCSAYNPSSYSQKAARRFAQEIGRTRKHGIPVGAYGWLPAAQQGNSHWLPNGALAVYDLLWIERMFDLGDQERLARQNGPFDQAIAQRLWDMFKEDAFEVIGYLETIFSGYGNVLTSEQERQNLLTSGKVCAVHQIKDSWAP